MIIIPLNDITTPVTIEIMIVTSCNWEYDFLHNGKHTGYDKTMPPKPFPHVYNLGPAMPGEIDGWAFRITNPDAQVESYSLTITWREGVQQLQQWTTSGSADAGKMVDPPPGDTGMYAQPQTII